MVFVKDYVGKVESHWVPFGLLKIILYIMGTLASFCTFSTIGYYELNWDSIPEYLGVVNRPLGYSLLSLLCVCLCSVCVLFLGSFH